IHMKKSAISIYLVSAVIFASGARAANPMPVAMQANKLFSQGVDFADKQFYKEAVAKFQAAVALDSHKAGYFNELGVALLAENEKQNMEQAIQAFQKATQL